MTLHARLRQSPPLSSSLRQDRRVISHLIHPFSKKPVGTDMSTLIADLKKRRILYQQQRRSLKWKLTKTAVARRVQAAALIPGKSDTQACAHDFLPQRDQRVLLLRLQADKI